MSAAMTKLSMLLAAAGIGATMMMLGTPASAAQCRSAIDDSGDAVVMCGSIAYYADEGGEDEDDDEVDEDGTLFVDVEDCEPGKYWMMETDEEGFDIPLAC
jgi:hypothetical protein